MHSELPPRKEQPPKSGEIDTSRRNFFFGFSGKSAEKRGELEKRRLPETCSQASKVSDRPKTGADEESEVDLARRRFINNTAGVLAGALVLDKTADIIGNFVDEQGGLEVIQAKAARLQEGVTGGRLAGYVSERQRESFHRERLEQLRDNLKEVFQKTYHISLVFGENPHHYRPDYGETSSSEAHLLSQLQAIKVLVVEFMRYPDFLIRDLHIPSITIRSNLKSDSESVSGFAMRDDHSISLNVADTLWNRLQDKDWQDNFRATIHHELYHLMDPVLQEEQAAKMYSDWVNLNPEGSAAYGNQPAKSEERPIGFASAYGMKNPREDRAMIFEALMIGWEFSSDDLSDMVLAKKVDFIRKQVFYLSHGLMDVYVLSDTTVMRMKKIRNHERLALSVQEPLFATISDEEYRSWQRHYTNILRKRDEEDARRQTSGGDMFLDR